MGSAPACRGKRPALAVLVAAAEIGHEHGRDWILYRTVAQLLCRVNAAPGHRVVVPVDRRDRAHGITSLP